MAAMTKVERARASLKRLREKSEEMTETVVGAVETSGAAFAMGVVQGRYGRVEVGPVPVDLLSGLALHGAAFAGIGGRNSNHLHHLGNGCLASYMTTIGTGVGADLRKKSLSSGMAGDFSAPGGNEGGGVLTDEEQAALADAI